MGGVPNDGAGAERFYTWGGEETHRQTTTKGKGWEVALSLTRRGHEGGGNHGCMNIN